MVRMPQRIIRMLCDMLDQAILSPASYDTALA
jgi:hypothetical protein